MTTKTTKKKTTKQTANTSVKANAKKQIISKPSKVIIGAFTVLAIAVCTVAIISKSYATGQPTNDVPITSTAQAEVSNVVVDASANNTIRVQFDYVLANGFSSATVDAAPSSQQSFGQTQVTGQGHYDQTLTGLADGKYYITIIISGNPDYLVGDPGPANQPLVITLPTTASNNNGGRNIWHIEKFFHKQKKYFQ